MKWGVLLLENWLGKYLAGILGGTELACMPMMPALPNHQEEVKSILYNLVEPSRQKLGCILYELLQNQENPTDFVFVEEWENEALLNVHLDSPHINEVDALIRCIVSG